MGCAICLDDFDQADGDAKRATALRCGHIFHYECLQTWFYGSTADQVHRPNQKRCPLCSVPTTPESMVRLFPSDGSDLDTYLSGQVLCEMQVTRPDGTPRIAQDELRAQKQLLNDLMDFNKAIQTYVMATHSVHVENMLKSGVKVRKLIMDLTKDRAPDLDDSLMNAIDALENATASFSTLFNDFSRRVRLNRKLETELFKEKNDLRTQRIASETTKHKADAKLADAQEMLREVERRSKEVQEQAYRNADMKKDIKAREDNIISRERDLDSRSRTMALQTKLQLSNIKSSTEAQLADMRKVVVEAQSKCAEAERERAAHRAKSCQLAEELRTLQERLKSKKAPQHPSSSNAKMSDAAAKDRKIKALQARIDAQAQQLKAAGIRTPERSALRASNRLNTESFVDLTRSSSPFSYDVATSPATPLDGVDFASQASASTVAAARLSPTATRRGKKRARASLSVEPEQLDDEMDEALFPMPGFGGRLPPVQGRGIAVHVHFNSDDTPDDSAQDRDAASTSTAGTASAPSTERKSPARSHKRKARASDPSGSVGSSSSSKPNYDWLHRSNGIALGPKRRPKSS